MYVIYIYTPTEISPVSGLILAPWLSKETLSWRPFLNSMRHRTAPTCSFSIFLGSKPREYQEEDPTAFVGSHLPPPPPPHMGFSTPSLSNKLYITII